MPGLPLSVIRTASDFNGRDEKLEARLLLRWRERLDKVNGRHRLRSSLAGTLRQRPDFVARLNLLHVFEVGRIEQLCAIGGQDKLRG